MRLKRIGLSVTIALLATGLTNFCLSLIVPPSTVRALAQNPQNRKAEADALLIQGLKQLQSNQFEAAVKSWQQALIIYREVKDRRGEGKVLGSLGNAYSYRGDYTQAIDYLEKALAVMQGIPEREGEFAALINLGNTYYAVGNYAKVVDYYQQSLLVAQQFLGRQEQGQALGNLGAAYNALGEYEKAMEYQQQSLALAGRMSDLKGEAYALGNLGLTYRFIGNYDRAIDSLQQALVLMQKIRDRAGEGTALVNLGIAYLAFGDYAKAIANLEKGVIIMREIRNYSAEGYALGKLGAAYNVLGDYSKGIEYQQKSLAIARELNNRQGQGEALNNLGYAFFKAGNLLEAEKALKTAIEVWESIRTQIPANRNNDKVSIFDTQEVSYRSLQKVLIALNKTDEALEIAERGRARAFVELLSGRLSPQNSLPLDVPLSPRIAQIKQIAREQKATVVEYSIIYDAFQVQNRRVVQESELFIWVIKPTGDVAFRQLDLKPLRQQNMSLAAFVPRIRQSLRVRGNSNANESSVKVGDRVRFKDKDDEANSELWEVISVDAQNGTVRVRLPSFTPGLNVERSIGEIQDEDATESLLQQLHQFLIQPIADLLPTDKSDRVIFIPQDELFLVPFPALQDAQGKYLIENHTILTSPAIQVLEFTRKQRQRIPSFAQKDLLVVGNPSPMPQPFSPLRYAEPEAREIAGLYNVQAIVGIQATESAIVAQMPNARLIHLATHGQFDDIRGLGSAIVLAPGGKDDGLLTAEEILNLKLNAELVVLSACDTGRGKLTGDGVIGLSRSLISAGVPSVIVSLWKVSDRTTSELMLEFYRQLQKNPTDKAQALRQAMLIKMKQYPAPRNWAAFTLIGEAE